MHQTLSLCIVRVCMHLPATRDQTLTVWSDDPVNSTSPASLIRMPRMLSVCPTNLVMPLPDLGSQIRTTPSGPPLASTDPFAHNAYTEPLTTLSALRMSISRDLPAPLRSHKHIL